MSESLEGHEPWAGSWPDDLVDRVAARDFVLVIGSGISANSRNKAGARPPDWRSLLQGLADKYSAAGEEALLVGKLLDQNEYLAAAQVVRSAAESSGRGREFVDAIDVAVDGPAQDQFPGNALHDALLRLDPTVLVTTNYDKTIERASSSGFKVHRYTSTSVGHALRRGSPILLKIHGTTDDELDLILTRTDYARLRQGGAHALGALQALFLTRTTLFVGYGFADPDLLLLLENAVGPLGGPPAHYWLTSDAMPQHQQTVAQFCYGTQPVFYRNQDHEQALEALIDLADRVDAVRQARLSP